MPLYEFVCTTVECPENTGHHELGSARILERFAKFDEIVECGVCGLPLKRIISIPKLNTRGCSGGSSSHTH